MKLRHKVSFLVFLVGSLVLVSTLGIHEYFSYQAAIIDSQRNLLALSKEISFHLDTFLNEKISKAKTLASTPLLIDALVDDNAKFAKLNSSERAERIDSLNQQWMATQDRSDPFIQGYLDNPVANFLETQRSLLPGEYGEIFLTNKYGAIIASTGQLTTLAHAQKQWWRASYNDGKGKVFIDDRGFDESVDGYVLGFVVPVFSDETIVGILKCNLNIKNNLEQFVRNFSLTNQKGSLKIVRSQGLVIMAEGVEPLSSNISEIVVDHMGNTDNSSLITKGRDGAVGIVSHSVVKTTLSSDVTGFGGTKSTIDQSRGNKGECWFTVASIPKSAVLASLYKTNDIQAAVGVGTIVFLALVAFLFGGRIVKPVSKLSEAAERISQGDMNVRIDESDDSDIGKAAQAFNQMAEKLKATQEARDKLMQNRMRSAQLEVLGTIAAGVAHEINNPIQGILNYATMIKNVGVENERVNDCADRIVHETGRITNITKNLLFYARENNPVASDADIAELITNAISLIEKKLSKSGTRVEVRLPEKLPQMKLFPQLFQQVVLNLVDNSYDALRRKKFTDDVPEITITGRIIKDAFELEVRDNGEGIPKDLVDKIKKPFFTTKPSSEGTGLGLSIVEEIVEKHGGVIRIESSLGQFTTVKMLFPVS